MDRIAFLKKYLKDRETEIIFSMLIVINAIAEINTVIGIINLIPSFFILRGIIRLIKDIYFRSINTVIGRCSSFERLTDKHIKYYKTVLIIQDDCGKHTKFTFKKDIYFTVGEDISIVYATNTKVPLSYKRL